MKRLYFVSLGVNTNVRNEKYGFMIRTRDFSADYIPKVLPQLIVIAKRVKKGVKKMNDWKCRFQQEPIDNRPHFIVGGRQSGKTIRLIKEASETNGVIVCPTPNMVDYVFQTARELGYVISKPITYDQWFMYPHYANEKPHYFDEYGMTLLYAFRRQLSLFERYDTKSIIIDEDSIKSLNEMLDRFKVSDMDGRELRFKIEVLGRNENND